MAEFEAGGHRYKTERMNAREQLKLLQSLGPLVPVAMQFLLLNPEDRKAAMIHPTFIAPFFDAFAAMPEAEVDRIISRCFRVVRRREGGNGSGVWGPPLNNGTRDQYEDIDLVSLFTIVKEVVEENLMGFSAMGSDPVPGSAPTPTSPVSPS